MVTSTTWLASTAAKADITIDGDELIRVVDSPNGTPVSGKVSIDALKNYVSSEIDATYLTEAEAAAAYQPLDADLTTLGAGGSGARDFLDLGTSDSPQFTGIELGHATDTTLARVAAGRASVEGRELAFRTVYNVKSPEFGAAGDGTTIDTTAIQAAITACGAAGGGVVWFPPGTYQLDAVLTVSSNSVVLRGGSRFGTLLRQTTANAGILALSGIFNGVSGLSFIYSGTPTSGGTAIAVTGASCTLTDFVVRSAYVGVSFSGSVSGGKVTDFEILDYESIGIHCNSMNDVFIHNFIMNAGNTTRGALGGIRLTNKAEAVLVSTGDILLGVYSLTTDADVDSAGVRPAYNNFTDVYFDSSSDGSLISKLYQTEFVGCWFSAGRSGSGTPGARLVSGAHNRFVSTRFFNSGSHGAYLRTGMTHTTFVACDFNGNSVTTGSGVSDGLSVESGATDFCLIGCSGGNGVLSGEQRYSVHVGASCDRFAIIGGNFDGITGGVLDDSSDTASKHVYGNVGADRALIHQQPIYLADGSESAPSYAFVNAKTTGFYRSGAQIRFAISGAGEMTLTASALAPLTNDGLALGLTTLGWADLFLATGGRIYHNNSAFDTWGTGTPEGAVTAPVGSTFRRTDGGASTTFYVKESGTGNTGWVAK